LQKKSRPATKTLVDAALAPTKSRALVEAIAADGDDVFQVIKAVQEGADPNALIVFEGVEMAFLHYAARLGRSAIVGYLLVAKGVDPNCRDPAGRTPLHLAAENGYIDVLIALKSSLHCDMRAKDHEGLLPIHWASGAGQLPALEWLLANNGGNVNDLDNSKRNCLFHAVRGNHDAMIYHLVNVKKMSLTSLCSIELTLMHHAVFKKAEQAIFALIKLGLSLEVRGKKGMLPLHLAVRSGLPEMVDFLVAQGVNKNAGDDSLRNAWFYGAADQAEGILKCLEKHQIALQGVQDNFGMTPVHIAAMGGNLAALMFFVNRGLSAFEPDKQGETPLSKAKKQGKKWLNDLAKIKQSADVGAGAKNSRVEQCAKIESRIAGCTAVEGYLSTLAPSGVVKEFKDEASKSDIKLTDKRERPSEPLGDFRVIKPKRYIPATKPAGTDNEPEANHGRLAASVAESQQPPQADTRPKF
jgi:ankyrin repeat protein